jgi:predicted nuclease of restriction endonuclease-like (RecB) superfamily
MSETNTKFTKKQIETYWEIHNLIPSNNEAMIANMMRLEGMIQELAIKQTIDLNK